MLGRTENVSGFSELFKPFDKASKIYLRSAAPSGLHFAARSPQPSRGQLDQGFAVGPPRSASDVSRHLDRLLLARYAPPGVLINDKLDILQYRGQTGAYLQAAPGEPQTNIVKMARPGLVPALRAILARAKTEPAPVRSDQVDIDQGGFTVTCNVVVIPFAGLPDVSERLFVVLFEEVSTSAPRARRRSGLSARATRAAAHDLGRIPTLEHELSSTTEYLQSLIEEHGQINGELGSANEELISGNEELQSLNEELETAKEELQSSNEELTTVNDELQHRSQEVGQINSDLINLLNTVDLPVVIVDQGRHIRRFTPQAQKLLNLLPSDIGRLFDDIKTNLAVPDLDRQIADVITSFVARQSEVQDRAGHWYRLQIRPYKAADERIDGAMVSLVDIDALKVHVHDAQEGQATAERADRAKDEFLAVLSHELRTPLSVLMMQTRLLRQGGADPVKRERACDRIERSTKLQLHLIEDLLDVSRIVTGKMRVDLRPTDLTSVVKASVDGVTASAAARSIELRVAIAPSLGPVAGDRLRLEQVVSNLLANALKFTPDQGRVEVLLERQGGSAHLQISDTGIGIDAQFLPLIFNRLTQQDSSTTRRHTGLGLGLAIVRYLVEAHGGTVRAESAGPHRGSTFHVTLPFLKAEPLANSGPAREERPAASAAVAPALLSSRILVVEDDAGLREVIAESLTTMGALVRTAESAAAGLLLLDDFRPDLLVCDIAMPHQDGYAFISCVRALGGNKGAIPAAALTALVGDSDRQRALASGFQAYLTKPVDIDLLARTLCTLSLRRSPALSLSR